jgi:glycerol transport system ATP-binding protein
LTDRLFRISERGRCCGGRFGYSHPQASLLRIMAGLDVPTTGCIVMDGVDVTGVPVRRRNVAMVYQQFINYPTLSVFENIASPLRVKGVSRAKVEARVREAAAA